VKIGQVDRSRFPRGSCVNHCAGRCTIICAFRWPTHTLLDLRHSRFYGSRLVYLIDWWLATTLKWPPTHCQLWPYVIMK